MGPEVAPPLADGRYRLVEVIGAGGMATVYAAWDRALAVERAVKVLSPGLTLLDGVRRRFFEEARTMARLRHPNIVSVHDVGEDEGVDGGVRVFFVMDLVTGGTLARRVREEGPLPPRLACAILDRVLAALDHAHEQGVIHRDVKPQNVLMEGDDPRLGDFGIARVRDDGSTHTGARLGTWSYMAPEQRTDASSVDARSDVYSAAATLFACLTGGDPAHLAAEDARVELLSGIPGPLARVVARGCRYRPADRYSSATAMRAAIATIRDDLPGERAAPVAPSSASTITPEDTLSPPPTPPAPPPAERGAIPEWRLPPAPPEPRAPSRLPLFALMFAGAVGVGAIVGVGAWILTPSPSATEEVRSDRGQTVSSGGAPAARRRPGRLEVACEPGCAIVVDRKTRGRGEWTGELSAGTHEVRLRGPGGEELLERVRVSAGRTTRFCWDFEKGRECG